MKPRIPAKALSAETVVGYHYPCPDGIFAALAARLKFAQTKTPVRFVPLTVYDPPTADTLNLNGGEQVYLLDYAGPDGFASSLARTAAHVTILDHHKTALEQLSAAALPMNVDPQLDMDRSGATIALDYFQPEVPESVDRMFRFIEDGDLWRWRLPGAKAFYAGLAALQLEYDANANPAIWDRLAALNPDEVIASGELIIKEQDLQVAKTLETAFEVQIGGTDGEKKGWPRCLAVRCDDVPQLRSRIGNELALASLARGLRGVAAVAYVEKRSPQEGAIKVSLRAIGDEDTTPISAAYGGGGHAKASSSMVPMGEFESWRV